MRQIVLDTETTGLETAHGHRIIEIGCIELVNRRPTGNHYHRYLQPDREIDAGAIEVHGITQEFLEDKPRFADIHGELLEYLSGAELVIHNAPFDVGFLDYEYRFVMGESFDLTDHCEVLDTLVLARKMHPGLRNSLDALCKRYDVDNSSRQLHGALLDAEILADVYLAMTGGQSNLLLDNADELKHGHGNASSQLSSDRPKLPVLEPTQEELALHEQYVQRMLEENGRCLWLADATTID